MKQLYKKISEMLIQIPKMDKQTALGILAPLRTEEQANMMIEYLSTIDLKSTKQTPIIKKALEIGKTRQ